MSGHEERNTIGEEQHRRLCAWLFGELEGDEARAFEAELEASPALQAERRRLEATIGLVRASAPAEALSEAARERVVAAAEGRPVVHARWSFLRGGGAGWKVAAGIALVFGTLVVVRTTQRRALLEEWQREEVARRNAPAESRPGEERADGAPGLQATDALAKKEARAAAAEGASGVAPYQYEPFGGAQASSAGEAEQGSGHFVAAPGPETLPNPPQSSVAGGPPAANDERAPEPELDAQTLRELAALGYGGGGGELPEAEASRQRAAAPAIARSQAEEPLRDTPVREASPPEDRAAPAPGKAVAVGSGAGSLPARLGGPAPVPGARYRGPSDSILPAPDGRAVAGESVELLRKLGYAGEAARTGKEGFFLGGVPQGEDGRAAPWSEHDLDRHCQTIYQTCRLQPRETPGAMFFRCWGDNPFELTALDRLSTFSVDVDTASYALARRYLTDGYLPSKEQVRTEEFVNAFDADVPPPKPGETFALALELAPSLFGSEPEAWMLRVAVRGEDVDRSERQPVALTFVVDVSGSMRGERIGLVKQAIALCLGQLSTTDSVAMVAFSNEARLVSPMVSAASRGGFENGLLALSPGGGTNVAAGLELGYELAASALTPGAVNRVVLLSDGVGNVGATDQQTILGRVARYREQGIYLNAIGVGMGNHNDAFLEQLADHGDGVCHYVDRFAEARRVFVDELVGTLQPIARDVKVQVEFDPEQVERYRLLGYENRAVADKDFRNDAVDAGEVNAGHQVVALYELVRRPGADSDAPLATARLRWKPPFAIDRGADGAAARREAEQASEKEASIRPREARVGYDVASFGYRRDVLVAQFAEVLRRSVHARGDSYAELLERTRALASERSDPRTSELRDLVERAARLVDEQRLGRLDDLERAIDELCRLHYLEGRRQQLEEPGAGHDADLSRDTDELQRRLEERIRELLREKHMGSERR